MESEPLFFLVRPLPVPVGLFDLSPRVYVRGTCVTARACAYVWVKEDRERERERESQNESGTTPLIAPLGLMDVRSHVSTLLRFQRRAFPPEP